MKQKPVAWADEIIYDLNALFDSEMIKEIDSGDALIRLDAAICAVEEAEERHTTPPAQPAPQQEPVGEMRYSCLIENMVVPVVPVELPAGTKLYAAPVQEPVAWMIKWNGEPTGNLFRDEGYATREMQRLNMLHPQDRRSLVPLYTTPPAAQRQSLTKERIGQIIEQCKITLVNYCSEEKQIEFARAIEVAHGITGEEP